MSLDLPIFVCNFFDMGRLKLLKASAGSGKTYKLAYEYVKNVVVDPFCYKNILAVTFTNKATKEMKDRILSEIDALCSGEGFIRDLLEDDVFLECTQDRREMIIGNAKKAQQLILHDYSRFSVMTIDKFFQKIFRAFVRELGLDSSYRIDMNDDYLLSLAVDRLIANFTKDAHLNDWVTAMIADRVEQGGIWALKSDILKISKNIFSREFDKEFYINNRDGIKEYFNTLKKIKELRETELINIADSFLSIAKQNDFSVDDYHYGKNGFANYVVKMANGDFENYRNRVSDAMLDDAKWGKDLKLQSLKKLQQPLLRELCDKWDIYKLEINTIDIILENHRQFVLLVEIAKELEVVCRTNNVLLLSNSLKIISALINGNDTPYIYEKIGSRYDVIMIDEFQDTSVAQWSNFLPLIENAIGVSPKDKEVVTLVGDIKQSMYRWRGGDWQLLHKEIPRDIDKDNISVITLDTNWRSSENIVNFNNAIVRNLQTQLNNSLNELIALHSNRISKNFVRDYVDISQQAYNSMEQKVSPKNISSGGYVEIFNYDDELQENLSNTIKIIEDAQNRGYKASDIAILVRAKADVAKIVEYVIDYKNSASALETCSYEVVSKDGLLLINSNVIKFILSCLKLTVNYKDTINLAIFNAYNNSEPSDPISDEYMVFFDSLKSFSLCEIFEKIVQKFSLASKPINIAYIQALHDKIIAFSSNSLSDVSSFLDFWISDGALWGVQLSLGRSAILIDTIHSAKGLEFPVVIIPYCDWRMKPGNNVFWGDVSNDLYGGIGKLLVNFREKMSESFFVESYLKEYILESIESLNIFYVAVTRAEKELYVMVPSLGAKQLKSYIDNCFVVSQDSVGLHYGESLISGSVCKNKYSFGDKTDGSIIKKHDNELVFRDHYFSCDYTQRIFLRLKNERYFEENIAFGARSLGVMMHKVFEKIDYTCNIDSVIQSMISNGELSFEDSILIKERIKTSFENSIIKKWFDSQWEVRNENTIISSSENGIIESYRPDRVMIKDGMAIVVDYKFGDKNSLKYSKQVGKYMKLLKSMGYDKVEGYLWYFNNNSIEKITYDTM